MINNPFSMTGKKIFITGGSAGIGLAISELLIAQGAQVVIADIVNAAEVAERIGAEYVHCDVSRESSMEDALATASASIGQKFHAVILNAGVGDVGPQLTDTPVNLLEKITAINQWGVLFGLKHAPAAMQDGGSIIATSSMASKISIPGTGIYSAAKAAVNSLVSMAAVELGERHIRVNAVCPGYVKTAMGSTPEEVKTAQAFTALGRHADPGEDIAGVFLFLCSDLSRYITGQALNVDGGWSAGPNARLLQGITGSVAAPGS